MQKIQLYKIQYYGILWNNITLPEQSWCFGLKSKDR